MIFLLREVASLNNLPCPAVTEAGFHYPLLSPESSALMVGSKGNGDQASQGPEHPWIVFLPLYDLPRQGRCVGTREGAGCDSGVSTKFSQFSPTHMFFLVLPWWVLTGDLAVVSALNL